ncbi:MAG: diguanylate cyclase, partial [Synergistaceae bacterium]|nr:diguanylate cyclase [Synergistaceae bacterium]
GDEFAVLMLQDGKDGDFDIVSRLEREISRVNKISGRDYRLAMSMGMSEWLPGASVPLEELVMEADRKMYENKAARKRAECGSASGG